MSNIWAILTLMMINISNFQYIKFNIAQLRLNQSSYSQEINNLKSTYKSLCKKEPIITKNNFELKLKVLLNNAHMLKNKITNKLSEIENMNSLLFTAIFESICYLYHKNNWELCELLGIDDIFMKSHKYFTIANGSLAGLATAYKAYCCNALSKQIDSLESLIVKINVKLAGII